jgi:hypothetical protein
LLSRRYYEPSERGYEIRIREYLERARAMRSASARRDRNSESEDK